MAAFVSEGSLAADNVKTVTARCHCGSIHYQITLPTAQLPISSYLCHCSACRHTFGALCVAHANLPSGVRPEFVAPSSLEDSATRYQAPGSIYETYFCTTCGSHVGGYCARTDTWIPSTVLFPSDVFELRKHYLARSAARGGPHEWLPRLGDRVLEVVNPEERSHGGGGGKVDAAAPPCLFSPPRPPTSPPPPPAAAASRDGSETEARAPDEERLRAQCHCGGVSFTLPRPGADVLAHAFLGRFARHGRWKAIADACNDCRRAGGVPVSAWAFVPRRVLESRVGRDLQLGTLRTYESSPGNLRGFCGVCGATVMFRGQPKGTGDAHNEDDDVVDIEVGILRAPEGVKAERWLTWRTNKISWLEAGCEYDAEFYESLSRGYRAWAERNHDGWL